MKAAAVLLVLERRSSTANLSQPCHYCGQVPLLAASDQPDDTTVISLLLEHGANVDETNALGQTALFIATKRHDIELVRFLLRHEANVRRRAARGGRVLVLFLFVS